MTIDEKERLRRWRLLLGKETEKSEGNGAGKPGQGCSEGEGFDLAKSDRGMDSVLEALYESDRSAGLGSSSPNIARWLGDIRTYFPSSAVRAMQQDALQRLNLTQILMEPEILETVDADVHLVATLLSLSKVIPEKTKDTARHVVRKVVNELEGHGHKRSSLRDIVLCVDQSGSMAASLVYSGIFGAVLASIRAVSTRMIVFDTAVADLTDDLQDPVDLLFGTQLGGGTDINRALAYCQQIITRPAQTILILITDLYEGGSKQEMLRRAAELVASGVQVICLLALSDKGTPSFDQGNAAKLASLGIPSFACTPDLFPDMMAAAIQKQDLSIWAAKNDIVTVRAQEE